MKKRWKSSLRLLITVILISSFAFAETPSGNKADMIPEALIDQVEEDLSVEDVADSLLLQDGSGTEWCIVVTRYGALYAYAFADGEWDCRMSGYGLFWAEDIRLVRHITGETGPDGRKQTDDFGFDAVSMSQDARMSWHWDGENFALTGWRDGNSWPGNAIIAEHSLLYIPDDGSATEETEIEDELKSQLQEFDHLPKTPEEASARNSVSRRNAEQLYPGWTMQRYSMTGGTDADAGYSKIENGMLYIRRAELHSDPETKTEYIDLLPIPVTASFRQRMETEDTDSLLDTSGYGDTFLIPDAIDTEQIPIPGIILENEILQYALVCLTEDAGIRKIAVAVPDYEGGWTVRLSKPLPQDIILDLLHNGNNEVLCTNGLDFSCGFKRVHGEWELTWVMGPNDSYGVTWNGVKGMDEEGRNVWDYGTFPGRDLFEFDMVSVPKTRPDAIGILDQSDWAVVSNANPKDRLHLRERPDKDGKAIGKFYNGTPVRILETSGKWVRVKIGTGQCLTGWMMGKYLTTGDGMKQVQPAFPYQTLLEQYIGSVHYANAYGELAVSELTGDETIIGLYENKKQSSWIAVNDDGDVSYVPVEWYGEGNG